MPLMSQLTAQLRSSKPMLPCCLTASNSAAAALSLYHHHYIRSCQTSLGMLLRLMPTCLQLCARLSAALPNKYFSFWQLLFCFSLDIPGENRTEQLTFHRYFPFFSYLEKVKQLNVVKVSQGGSWA